MRFPRLVSILSQMPPPHPPFKMLFLQQLRAEVAVPRPETKVEDYVFTVELVRWHNGVNGRSFKVLASGAGRLYKYNRIGPCPSTITLWTHEEAPNAAHLFKDACLGYEGGDGEDEDGEGSESGEEFQDYGVIPIRARYWSGMQAWVWVTRPDFSTCKLGEAAFEGGRVDPLRTGYPSEGSYGCQEVEAQFRRTTLANSLRTSFEGASMRVFVHLGSQRNEGGQWDYTGRVDIGFYGSLDVDDGIRGCNSGRWNQVEEWALRYLEARAPFRSLR